MPFDRIPDLGNANVGTLRSYTRFKEVAFIGQLPFFRARNTKGDNNEKVQHFTFIGNGNADSCRRRDLADLKDRRHVPHGAPHQHHGGSPSGTR